MNKTNKILSLFLIVGLLVAVLPGAVMAEEGDLPDLYFVAAEFMPCDEAVKAMELEARHLTEDNIINTAEDGSYFDIQADIGETGGVSIINRTLCYFYVIGNIGNATVDNTNDLNKPFSVKTYFTDWVWNIRANSGSSIPWVTIGPGEFYESTGFADLSLNNFANESLCIGIELNIKPVLDEATEMDTENNRRLLCFDTDEYVFPGTPENIRLIKAEGRLFEFKWDEVADAEGYQVYAVNYSPNADMSSYTASVNGTSAVFEFSDDDFYCMRVTALNGTVLGKSSDRICYSPANILFSDVPLDSWYFPYMQELQANGIVNGYKDKDGNDLGIFGPADNLTVAESLKMGMTAFWTSKYVEIEGVSLPESLQNHWAVEYIQKGMVLELSFLNDLENFNPDRPITRGEIIGMLSEIKSQVDASYYFFAVPMSSEEPYYSFPDIAGTQYADEIEYAREKGYINGYDDGTFRPDALLNRAEIVKILYKFRD